MTFDEASAWVVPFGKKFKGYTLDQIAATGDGMDWLIWIVSDWKDMRPETKDIIETYLDGITDRVAEHQRAKGLKKK